MMSEQPRGCPLRNVELVKDRAQFGTGHLFPSNREPRQHAAHLRSLPSPAAVGVGMRHQLRPLSMGANPSCPFFSLCVIADGRSRK
jgi:hypothetical protein